MRVDHGFAAVQFVEDRREGRVTQIFRPVAGEEADAIGLERIEGVFDFFQAAVDVGDGQHGEQAEASFVRSDHFRGGVLVQLARDLAGFFGVSEVDAGGGGREHRGGDAALVHRIEILRGRVVFPDVESGHWAHGVFAREQRQVIRRDEMLMNVQDAAVAGLRGQKRAGAERGQSCQEFSPRGRKVIHVGPFVSLFGRRSLGGGLGATEIVVAVFLALEHVAHDRDAAFFHQARHQRDGVVVENRRRHADGHAFGPIERRHVGGAGAEAEVLTLVLSGQIRAAVD